MFLFGKLQLGMGDVMPMVSSFGGLSLGSSSLAGLDTPISMASSSGLNLAGSSLTSGSSLLNNGQFSLASSPSPARPLGFTPISTPTATQAPVGFCKFSFFFYPSALGLLFLVFEQMVRES